MNSTLCTDVAVEEVVQMPAVRQQRAELFSTGKSLAGLTADVTTVTALSTYARSMQRQQQQVCSLGVVKGHKIACDV